MSIEAVDTVTEKSSPLSSTDDRLNVNSLLDDPFVTAAENGKAFIWSTEHSASNNEHVLYVRNTSTTELLHIVEISAGGKDTALITVNSVTGDGDGSDSNEFNMDFSAVAADAVHKEDDIGSLGIVTPIMYRNISAYGSISIDTQRALVLGEDDAITIEFSKAGNDTFANIMGYYE